MLRKARADEISEIAFGSHGVEERCFPALHFDLFTHLRWAQDCRRHSARLPFCHPDRAEPLLTALAGLGLAAVV